MIVGRYILLNLISVYALQTGRPMLEKEFLAILGVVSARIDSVQSVLLKEVVIKPNVKLECVPNLGFAV